MKKFFKAFLVVFLLNCGLLCFASEADTPIQVFRLKNGQTIVIKEVHANPIVTIDTWVRTGSAMETEENNGISHFLEHLMFKGTKAHPAGEFMKILEDKGARCNAATSRDFTHYYVTSSSKYVDTALSLHADMMQNPEIPQAEMDKERNVVLEEIRRSQDSPGTKLYKNLFSMIFSEHPYRREVLGTMENVENMTRDDVLGYYNERYVPSNIITVVVGDVNTDEILSKMKKEYCPETSSVRTRSLSNEEKKQSKPNKSFEKIEKGDYKTGYILLGFKGVPIDNVKENYALDAAASMLGGTESSRLYQTLKQDKNLVTSISSAHYSLKEDSVFLIKATFEPKKYQAVRKAIFEELEKFRNNPVTEEELNRMKTLSKRKFKYNNESVQNISSSIGYCMIAQDNIDCYNNHLKYTDNVSEKDVKKVVKKYLDPQKVAVSILLPKEMPVNNVKSNAETDIQTIKDSTRSVLDNGSVLITTKNTSNDIIAMKVFFRGGRFIEPKPGMAGFLSSTMMYGTKNRPYKEFIKEIEDMGVSINVASSNDYFAVSLKSTKDDFDKAFEIMADIINNPSFEQKYIQKNKEDFLANLKKQHDVPVNIAAENFHMTMYKDHPYGHIGSVIEKNIDDITRKDIVDYWSRTFITENMIVSAAGDIEHEELAKKLSGVFFPSGKTPPELNYSDKSAPVFKLEKNKIVRENNDSSAAWILLGWPVGSVQDNKELMTFKVINSLLSGGMSSRLHKTFREDQGLAYSVGSSYKALMDRGHFVFYIGTKPKNVELVKTKFLEEVQKLKTQPLTQVELDNVKSKIIGNYEISQETNGSKCNIMGGLEVVDKKFGFIYDFPDLISKVTAEDIIRTANKYFNDPYVLSVVAPQDAKDAL